MCITCVGSVKRLLKIVLVSLEQYSSNEARSYHVLDICLFEIGSITTERSLCHLK